MFLITTDPQNDVYKNLIDLAFTICDAFILVVRKDPGLKLDNSGMVVLEKLRGSLKYMKSQYEWPGTVTLGPAADVYYYNSDDTARRIIQAASDSLHSWVQPNLPEDLSFLKNNKPWLVNSAHEKESTILIEDDEEIKKLLEIKGLNVSKLGCF